MIDLVKILPRKYRSAAFYKAEVIQNPTKR